MACHQGLSIPSLTSTHILLPSHATIHISFKCLWNRLKLGINLDFALSYHGTQLSYSPDTLAGDILSASYTVNTLGMGILEFLKYESIIIILLQGVFLLWLICFAQQFKDTTLLISVFL